MSRCEWQESARIPWEILWKITLYEVKTNEDQQGPTNHCMASQCWRGFHCCGFPFILFLNIRCPPKLSCSKTSHASHKSASAKQPLTRQVPGKNITGHNWVSKETGNFSINTLNLWDEGKYLIKFRDKAIVFTECTLMIIGEKFSIPKYVGISIYYFCNKKYQYILLLSIMTDNMLNIYYMQDI